MGKETKLKKVFICSPYRPTGDTEEERMESFRENTEVAKAACRFACEQGAVPYAPHLYFPQYLDDEDDEEREQGIVMGLTWLARCDELWVIGKRITEGMKREIEQAQEWGIIIRRVRVEKRKVEKAGVKPKETEQEDCMEHRKNEEIEQKDIMKELGDCVDQEGMDIGKMISGLFKMASLAYCRLPIMSVSTEMIDVYREDGVLTVVFRDPDVQDTEDDSEDHGNDDNERHDDVCQKSDFQKIADFLNEMEVCIHED